MKFNHPKSLALCGAVAMLFAAGCCKDKCAYVSPDPIPPLGTMTDPVWQAQERNAEAADFVIHEHEFGEGNSELNAQGEIHVRQIAARAKHNNFPILIEPSSDAVDPTDEYGYPVNNDRQLDERRRQMIMHSLAALGLHDVDRRVVLAPDFTPGFNSAQAEASYYFGQGGAGRNGGGFGGGGFGGGGGGFGGR